MSAEERSGAGILPFGDEDEVRGYLEVTVTDTISRPISGATVKLFLGGTVVEKTTDNSGKATFSVLAYLTYRLEVEKAGYAKASQDVYVGEGTNRVTISLNYQVNVTVLDNTNNNPIAGARVVFWVEGPGGVNFGDVRYTNSQGRAVFELSHRNYTLEVTKDGYAMYRNSVSVDRPGMDITVKLQPTILEVTVVNTKNPPDPIPGAVVRLFDGETKVDEKIADNNGKVTFRVQAATYYDVEAEKEGYAKKRARGIYIRNEGTNTFTLSLDYLVTVTVVDDKTNAPIAGAKVTFRWLEEEGIFQGETDSQGKAVFELSHRNHELYVEKGGYVPYSKIVSIDRPGMSIPVRLIPATSPTATLDVKVRDTRSPVPSPIPGAIVRVFRGTTNVDEKKTDNNGQAIFIVEANATYRLEIEKEGYAKASFDRYVTEGINYISVGLQYLVTVTVLDNTNNRPIAGAKVTFSWTEGGTQRSVSKDTDSQGRAVFELSHRSYNLSVSRDGYAPYSGSVTVDEPGESIIVKLNPSYRLEITVVDYKGRPISGATVTVSRGGQRVDSKTTGQEGKVTFQLEQGTYTIEASKTGYKQPAQINVTLDRDKSEQLTLRGYTLIVTVRDSATRQPISGATVKVFDQSTGREVDSGTTA